MVIRTIKKTIEKAQMQIPSPAISNPAIGKRLYILMIVFIG